MRNTKHYMSLPFNPKLKERARELRKAGMLHETLLWTQLKKKNFKGLDFDRQKIIGNYIVDFFCAEKHLVIEADGASHQDNEEHDKQRDDFLENLGITIIRISAKDILNNIEGVMELLRNHPAFTVHLSSGEEPISPTPDS